MSCRNCDSDTVYTAVVEDPGEVYWHSLGAKGSWSIVAPVGKLVRNNVSNPSFEFNTDGWIPSIGSTMTRVPGGTFGGYQLHVTGTGQPIGVSFQSDPAFPSLHINCGEKLYASIDVLVRPGAFFRVVLQRAGIAPLGECYPAGDETTGFGTGDYQRIFTSFECRDDGSGGTGCTVALFIEVQDFQSGTPEFYIDSARIGRIEVGDYFDGDSPGAAWVGTPHASTSYIDQFSRSYGSSVNLNEIGFNITGDEGTGLPSVENQTTPFAQLMGSNFDRQRIHERVITLLGEWTECTTQAMHEARKDFWKALNYRFKMQCNYPLILQYQLRDCDGRSLSKILRIPVHYTSGGETTRKNPIQQKMAIQFTAYEDLFWSEEFERSQIISPNVLTTVDNPGSEDSWIVISFVGTGANPSLTSIENRSTGHIVTFGVPTPPYVFASGSYVLLETTPRRSRALLFPGGTTIMSQVRFSESNLGMLRLVPGENEIMITGTDIEGVLRWKVRHTTIDFVECSSLREF